MIKIYKIEEKTNAKHKAYDDIFFTFDQATKFLEDNVLSKEANEYFYYFLKKDNIKIKEYVVVNSEKELLYTYKLIEVK